ncbi:MAG: hypothetical protein U1F98_06240 [Verrucomicrobiota bacterium]
MGRLTAAVVDLDLHSALSIRLGGTNAGVDFGQVVALETFNLIDATASLDVQMQPGFVGAIGNSYLIVRLDGTNSVGMPLVPGNTNGFSGLGEGSLLSLPDGAAFRISYKGGDGNDIVLTQVAVPPVLHPLLFQGDGSILISGAGTPGEIYEVQSTTNLGNLGGWILIGTTQAQPDGSLFLVETNPPAASQVYFRLHHP